MAGLWGQARSNLEADCPNNKAESRATVDWDMNKVAKWIRTFLKKRFLVVIIKFQFATYRAY